MRVPLPPAKKALLQRRADEERRSLGQMAAIWVLDQLPGDGPGRDGDLAAWRTPNLLPSGGCPTCGADTIGLDAPVAQLLSAAVGLQDQHGWLSETLLQRRLRVPQTLARWLIDNLT
ncbi:MAG: hypothetical protein ACREEO_11010 [Phenylobacterium sp.]